jgi:hypothetical protein
MSMVAYINDLCAQLTAGQQPTRGKAVETRGLTRRSLSVPIDFDSARDSSRGAERSPTVD